MLALARSGDAKARCEVAQRYLLGSDGFPRHFASAVEYLSLAAVLALPEAARVVAECMTLNEILQARLLGALERAAEAGLAVAQAKLGAWRLVRHVGSDSGIKLLRAAARQGQFAAQAALEPLDDGQDLPAPVPALQLALQAMARHQMLDPLALARAGADDALAAADLHSTCTALAAALALGEPACGEVADQVVRAIDMAEAAGQLPPSLAAPVVEPVLEARACAGDRVAAYALGRALCGIPLGGLPARAIAEGQNIRKGAALLLRAADAGRDEAWLHLYRLHADHQLSVANPQMARFFLEKAASSGLPEAQRMLGALLLRGASTLQDSEQALGWLHQAALHGDPLARVLQRSLLLPLEGDDDEAEAAIAAVEGHDRWLAARLRIARDFGLTKLEALCFDPVSGRRPWGLVVGKNPFISQIRLSAPRAIPALTAQALQHLNSAGELFERHAGEADRHEGDLRRRSLTQRRLFARLGLHEPMFFAVVSSDALDSFRLGSKWAHRARQPLRMALAETPQAVDAG
jgi:TPR repeat protein